MNIEPAAWPPNEPACYGVCCPVHKSCARYSAVDFITNPAQVFTDHCGPDRPLYMPQRAPVQVEVAAKAGKA